MACNVLKPGIRVGKLSRDGEVSNWRHESRDKARKSSRERKKEDVSGDKVARKHAHFGQLWERAQLASSHKAETRRAQWSVP
jgi:hypothetical protein